MTKSNNRNVNPDAVRYYRERLGKTQEQLAEESGLSRISIQRYESKGDSVRRQAPNKKSLEKLECALKVSLEQLMQEPPAEGGRRDCNRVGLKTDIAGPARAALAFVAKRYGLTEAAIIDWAPLAFLILAERSLCARLEAVQEAGAALQEAAENASRRLPFMRDRLGVGFDEAVLAEEEESISKRRVFQEYYDGSDVTSPFAGFLENELNALDLFQKGQNEFVSWSGLTPHYKTPVDFLAEELGLNEADQAERRTLENIRDGWIDFGAALKRRNADDFRGWLEQQQRELDFDL